MSGLLEGKVAVITGAGSGMGRGMAIRFTAEGANVVMGDISVEGMDETSTMVAGPGQCFAVACDVTHKTDTEALVATAVEKFGKVDIAVANAGWGGRGGNCFNMTEEQWDMVFDVNARGAFFTLQAGVNQMIVQGGGGRLIAVASMLSDQSLPSAPAYCASKGAVTQVVRTFAQACGPYGVTANAISPGFIATPMSARQEQQFDDLLLDRTPLGIPGQPADIASAATFLASDESRYLTGAIIPVDGGFTAGVYSQWLAGGRILKRTSS